MRKRLLVIFAFLYINTLTGQTIKDTVVINDILIKGEFVEPQRSVIPYTTTIIPHEQIAFNGKRSALSVASDFIPGLMFTERGTTGYGVYTGSAGALNLRGVGGSPTTGMLVAVDGIAQYMGVNGHHIADSYPETMVERIEVVRGPASTVYGSNAMGGVINIITKEAKRGNGWNAELEAAYGSYNTQRYSGIFSGRQNKFTSFIAFNYDKTSGHRQFGGFGGGGGIVKLGYDISSHLKANIDFSFTKFISHDPGTIFDPAKTDTLTAKVFRGMSSIGISNRYDKTDGGLNLFYNFGDHKLYYGWHSDDNNAGVQLFQNFRYLKGNKITVGVDYKNYGGRTEDIYGKLKLPSGRKTINEMAGYLLAQQSLYKDKLMVNAGLRYDNNSSYGSEWVPQAGLMYRLPKEVKIKAVVSKGYRSPTIKELYYFPTSNENLRSEKMMNYEVGIATPFLKNRLNVELTGYLSKGDNLIQTEMTPLGPKNSNTGTFSNKGVEILASFKVDSSLQFITNYSFLHTEKPILSSPKHQLYIAGNYNKGAFGFNLNFKYVNSLYTRIDNKQSFKEDFSLLGARVNFNAYDNILIYLEGRNLLNQKYEYTWGYPMPGTTVMIGVKFLLSGKSFSVN